MLALPARERTRTLWMMLVSRQPVGAPAIATVLQVSRAIAVALLERPAIATVLQVPRALAVARQVPRALAVALPERAAIATVLQVPAALAVALLERPA